MSLRGRVLALVGLVLLVSLSIYTVIAWNGARQDLAAEMQAACKGGAQTIRSAFEDLPRSDHWARDLRQLVATFDGNRHIRAVVLDQLGRTRLASTPALPSRAAPGWFSAALVSPSEPAIIVNPKSEDAVLTLQPEPASDIAALWTATRNAAGLFALAAVIGLGLIYWVIGRALAPLADLSRGLGAIGATGTQESVQEEGPPELLGLQRGFNAMAERLGVIDARNRALEAQLLTIQDEERAEIARDLHDEIGPHLFAVTLDAEMISRSLGGGGTKFIPEREQFGDADRTVDVAVERGGGQVGTHALFLPAGAGPLQAAPCRSSKALILVASETKVNGLGSKSMPASSRPSRMIASRV